MLQFTVCSPRTPAAMTGHRKTLIVAYAGLGHINPSLQFANRLLRMGVDVTFCSSHSVVQRIDKETIPHGLTFAPFSDGHDNGKPPHITLDQFISDFGTKGASAVAEIITAAAAAGQPFDYLVYTTALPWAARVADAHGVKSALLWCQSATILVIYYYYYSDEYQSLITSNINPTFTISLPGLPPLNKDDLPSFLFPSYPKEHEFLIPLVKNHVDVIKIAPRVLVNTFNDLETESIRAIEKLELLPVGPLIPSEFLDGTDSSDNSFVREFFEKAEESYIQWLNTKPKTSVVYVSFGTIVSLSMDQLEEVATGLLESRQPFLWVIRDTEQAGRLSRIEELQKQGMIVSWCSQLVVLSHQAIGCFVTHCGWNSTLEALAVGVSTVAFPNFTDQGTNAKLIEDVWKTGVRVKKREGDGMVEAKEIKRCVDIVMEDGEMKKNAEKWSKLAREAFNNGGSSPISLQAFLDDA